MKNTSGDLFLPPLHIKQHPPRHVFDSFGLILASNPYGIVSKLGDFLIDKWETLGFDLSETINRRLVADAPYRVRQLLQGFPIRTLKAVPEPGTPS